jgi:hypothetical protein
MRFRVVVSVIVTLLAASTALATITSVPTSITVLKGQNSGVVTLNIAFAAAQPPGTRTLRFTGLPSGVTTLPASVTFTMIANSSTATTTFQYVATTAAPVGTTTVTITDPTTASPSAGTTAMTLIVANPAPVATAIMPTTIQQGASSVPFAITGTGFITGAMLSITPAGFTATQVTVASATQITFLGSAALDAVVGSRQIVVANSDGQRTKAVTVQVLQRPPAITAVSPPAVVLGARTAVVTLVGGPFQPGAQASTRSNTVTVLRTTVLSSSAVQVLLGIHVNATPGPVTVFLRNPDQSQANPPGVVLIYPRDSLAAPLAVTAVNITTPLPGTLVSPNEPLYPRALLATSGSGAVIGSWRLGGMPFDRFVISATGGRPAEVVSTVPIPTAFVGERTLELVIEQPVTQITAAVRVFRTDHHAAALRILAPRDRAVVGKMPPLFRWSLVPGAFSYEVEVARGPRALPLTFRTSRAEWTPSTRELERIGAGVRAWRVRPLFANGQRGAPTPARTIMVLPAQVALDLAAPSKDSATNRWRLRWSGGVAGLLYRVEFLAADGSRVLFSALTRGSEYLVPPAGQLAGRGLRVRVRALGPDGGVYGISNLASPPNAAIEQAGLELILAAAPAVVTGKTPADGSSVADTQPVVSAQWTGGTSEQTITLLVDDTDVTPISTVETSAITFQNPLPLSAGEHKVALSLGAQLTTWSFTIEPAAGEPAAPDLGAEPGGEGETVSADASRLDWTVNAEGTVTFNKDDPGSEPNTAHVQLSGQLDASDGTAFGKATADLAWRSQLEEPRSTTQESRNWLAEGGMNTGGFRPEAIVGYTAPRFVDGTELLTTGVARGGAQATLGTPVGAASYYRTVSGPLVGTAGGTFGPEQTVSAWAFEAPELLSGLQLRAVGLDVEDEAGVEAFGGTGKLYGIYGKVPISSVFNVVFEGARGDYTPNEGSTETERQGSAYLLGLSGGKETWSYTLTLRQTDAEFVNPANPGFSAGAASDRQSADLGLRGMLGATTLDLQVRHQRSGGSDESVGAEARESAFTASLSAPLSATVTLNVGGNVSANTGDADTVNSLPNVDSSSRSANATLSETLGQMSLSQTINWQSQRDKVNPTADQSTTSLTLAGSGSVHANLQISGTASATRTDADASVGRTDLTQVSINPIWSLSALGLALQPSISYGRTKNDLLADDTRTEQYALVVGWTPPKVGSYVALQLSGDWSRSRTSGADLIGFTRRVAVTLTLRWGGQGSSTPTVEAAPPPASTAWQPRGAGLNRVAQGGWPSRRH